MATPEANSGFVQFDVFALWIIYDEFRSTDDTLRLSL